MSIETKFNNLKHQVGLIDAKKKKLDYRRDQLVAEMHSLAKLYRSKAAKDGTSTETKHNVASSQGKGQDRTSYFARPHDQ